MTPSLALCALLAACRSVGVSPHSPPDQDSETAITEAIPTVGPAFQPERGLYDEPFDLVLSTGARGASIRYTLDGRDPHGATALRYDGPVPISTTTVVRATVVQDGIRLDDSVAHTYVFPADILRQAAPADWPTTWWTWYVEGGYPADYGMDPEIYEDPAYTADFPDTFRSLPILSLAMDPADLFGRRGIYENPLDDGADWERPVSVEWIPNDPEEASFQVQAGIRTHGGASRDPACSPKKSFRLAFRSDYGAASLDAPLFPDSDVSSFDGLILRAGYNLSWIHWSATQRSQATYRRDDLARLLQGDMGHLAPHERIAFLLVDGLFWGLYVVHERPDAAFMAAYLGGESEDWDVINTGSAIDGSGRSWNRLMDLAEAGLADSKAYAEIQRWVDVGAFADYYLLNIYLGNTDWPYNNWVAARRREEGAGFLFFPWDAEHTLENLDDNVIDVDGADSPGRLFQRLRENEEFRALFGDRVRRFLLDGGALTPDAVLARWDALGDIVDPAVVAESARWGDYRRDVNPYSEPPYELYTVDQHYLREDRRIREQYLPRRTDVVLGQLVDAGLN